MKKSLYELLESVGKLYNKYILTTLRKRAFGTHGKKIYIGRKCTFYGIGNIYCGSSVSIGDRCLLMCTRAKIIIGDHVMFGPNVTCVTEI